MVAQPRALYIDYLRGFMFSLMAFDHALHGYAQNWGKFWFIQDFDRSLVWDAFYLFDQSIIMPMIFFIAGLNVLPSFKRRGLTGYVKHRFVKLGIPFIVCILLFVPLLTFPRYCLTVDPLIDYGTYWVDVFFSQKLQAGPLWVCYALFLYSLVLLFLNVCFSSFIPALGRWVRSCLSDHPLQGILTLIGVSTFILGISDLVWGAPWWIGFWKLFYLQGGRFLLYFFYFILGAGVRESGILDIPALLEKFSKPFRHWFGVMSIAAIGYVGYALGYFDQGAYSDDFRHQMQDFFSQGGEWSEFWSFLNVYGFETLKNTAPGVLVRTSLLGILCLFQFFFLLSVFYRFCHKASAPWRSLAQCCYAIFLTHEVLVVWLQYAFIGIELPVLVKILFVFGVGFGMSWVISEKVLLKVPYLRTVLR